LYLINKFSNKIVIINYTQLPASGQNGNSRELFIENFTQDSYRLINLFTQTNIGAKHV